MEVSTWVALGSAIVALLSFFDRLADRKARARDQELRDLVNDIDGYQKEVDQRFAAMDRRIVEQALNISQVKLDIITQTGSLPTREQLTQSIEVALRPINTHITRVDRFMEDAYRSGAFIKGE